MTMKSSSLADRPVHRLPLQGENRDLERLVNAVVVAPASPPP